MRVTGISRPALITLAVVGAWLLIIGIAWVLSWTTRHTDSSARVLPAAATLAIDGRNGDIRIVGADRPDVRLTTTVHRSLFGRPHARMSYTDGRLHLDAKCSTLEVAGFNAHCAVSYLLEVPRGAAVRLLTRTGDVRAKDLGGDVRLETRTGDVRAKDLGGDARLETRSGDVRVVGVGGNADLETLSGDVDAIGVRGGRLRLRSLSGDVDADASSTSIDATTASGDVDVRAREAGDVRAETSSGDVHVRVPDVPYAVRIHVESGEAHVEVPRDAGSAHHIVASTLSGDIHVEPGGSR